MWSNCGQRKQQHNAQHREKKGVQWRASALCRHRVKHKCIEVSNSVVQVTDILTSFCN